MPPDVLSLREAGVWWCGQPHRAGVQFVGVHVREAALVVGRVAFAATAVVAITYQFSALDHVLPSFSHGNFFSFFTIQSNILAAALLIAAAVVRRASRTLAFDILRGAATLYIAITGVVFALLLAGLQEELDTHIGWVDLVVHKLIPAALVADWLIDPPRHRISLRAAVTWLAYPLAWFGYTLVRGVDTGWYPYPFVDVDRIGYGGVLWRSAIMLVAFAAGAVLIALIGNARRSRLTASPSTGFSPST